MPTKVSEKKIIIGSILLVAALFIFIKTTVVTTPVRVSEKGLLLCIVASGLLVVAIRFFKQAVIKM